MAINASLSPITWGQSASQEGRSLIAPARRFLHDRQIEPATTRCKDTPSHGLSVSNTLVSSGILIVKMMGKGAKLT